MFLGGYKTSLPKNLSPTDASLSVEHYPTLCKHPWEGTPPRNRGRGLQLTQLSVRDQVPTARLGDIQ